MNKKYQVLKFYCYTPLKSPQATAKAHHEQALKYHLHGRLKIAPEGINGTLSGLSPHCQAYIAYLRSDPRFATLTLNQMDTPAHVHHKLCVRLKKEIVHAGLPHITPSPHPKERHYLTPQEFEAMRHQPDTEIMDVRSNYEHRLGTLEKARTFDIDNFREFPQKVAPLNFRTDKKYLLVCTSGIKCEKARDYLTQVKKVPHVYHLQGGIIGYGQQTDGNGFRGVCYVFDERITLPINRKKPSIISRCHACHTPSYRMINCANPTCHMHMPLCPPCSEKQQGACSPTCQKSTHKRPYNGSGYSIKKTNPATHPKGAQT